MDSRKCSTPRTKSLCTHHIGEAAKGGKIGTAMFGISFNSTHSLCLLGPTVRNMVDLHVDFWVFTQNILRHHYQTPHKNVHITLCQHVLQNCQFLGF